jgi:osmotically inducible protein OsmC
MPNRKAHAVWEGDLKQGQGKMRLGSGAYEGAYSFQTRMGKTPGTNPEELIGAALAGCFSMALAGGLSREAQAPRRVETDATVHFEMQDGGWAISRIDLATEVEASGIDEERFRAIAEETKKTCPVSKALTGTEIRLEARLLSGAAR